MPLEDYWGIGPKTRDTLDDALGSEAAIDAIERADVDALADAGLSPGRVTRILRHVHGAAGMELLATSDARSVYKTLIDRIADFAVTDRARNRIRICTPLPDVEDREDRLDRVSDAVDAWAAADDATRTAVRDAFEAHAGTGNRAAVETAAAIQDTGIEGGPFDPILALDRDALDDAAAALAALGDSEAVPSGVDEELDRLRGRHEAVDELVASGLDALEAIQAGARTSAEFGEAYVEYVSDETGVAPGRVREHAPDDAVDAATFVSDGLRALAADLDEVIDERTAEVRSTHETAIDETADTVEAAREAVGDAAFHVSLARFWRAFDLTRPTFTGERAVAVDRARNVALDAEGAVQPVSYAVGAHGLSTEPAAPREDRVAVLTGANSGGKTTLLETLCECTLLAHMGLGVPADAAEVGRFDAVVFHRRHASFNAGVLESTLRTIVPPVTREAETLMLVDEFEAITEPGRAADTLNGLVRLTVDAGAAGVFVTHLAEELAPLPDAARTDGISAAGLTDDLELEVDYQPQFGTIGKSTPEFIISRLIANASDREERGGYEALADALGTAGTVQQTLQEVAAGDR